LPVLSWANTQNDMPSVIDFLLIPDVVQNGCHPPLAVLGLYDEPRSGCMTACVVTRGNALRSHVYYFRSICRSKITPGLRVKLSSPRLLTLDFISTWLLRQGGNCRTDRHYIPYDPQRHLPLSASAMTRPLEGLEELPLKT
jgi:hypothetical protein